MKTKPSVIFAALFGAGLVLGATLDAFGQREVEIIKQVTQSRGPWLGVYLQDVTPKLAKKENLKTEEGAYVTRVMENSPADSAGILEGDVIVEFNGRRIYDAEDVVRVVRKAEVGIKAKVIVMRGGEKKELNVTLRKYPRRRPFLSFMPPNVRHRVMIFKGGGAMGLGLMELNPQLGKYFEAPEGKGVLVESVKEGSAAEKAGFRAGDVILKIGDKNVEKIRDVHKQLSKYEEGDKANFEILRKGTRMTLSLQVEESEGFGGFGFMRGDLYAPEPPDIDIELFGPDDEDWLDFRLPDIEPQLHKFRIELDRLRDKILDSKNDIERKLLEQFDKVQVRVET